MRIGLVIVMMISLCITGCQEIVKLGGSNCINVQAVVPANVNVAHYKKIAVIDFDYDHKKEEAAKNIGEWINNELQNAKVDGQPYFEVLSRSQMKKLLSEQIQSLQGFVDQKTAAKIGKLTGAQAVVTGRVSSYSLTVQKNLKEVTDYQGKKAVVKKVPCIIREGYVEFTANFIDATTGQLIASTNAEGQIVSDQCQEVTGSGGGLGQIITDSIFETVTKRTDNVKVVRGDVPDEKLMRDTANLAIEKFIKNITPHYEVVCMKIKKNDVEGIDINLKSKSESDQQIDAQYEIAYQYAIRQQWDDAIAQWEKILSIDQKRASALYNIGVAFEIKGDLYVAEEQYKKAIDIKCDNVSMDALARVRKAIKDREKICQQMGGSRCGK